jgi:hypothetical protein
VLDALQSSWLAHAIGGSQMITASLSAVHLLGFTLVMGSALVSNLRMMGQLMPDRPAVEVTRPAARAVIAGATLSAATGLLLFVPRAIGAAANPTFRVKLTLIAAALLVQLVVQNAAADRPHDGALNRAVGAVGLALWAGVALAACAFILLE